MKKWFGAALIVLLAAAGMGNSSCKAVEQKSASGVTATTVQVQKGADGLTIEQRNVRDRLVEDNKPGSIKHLYVISAYSGQVLIYSTVRGKVTSSSKRLMPSEARVYSDRGAGAFHVRPLSEVDRNVFTDEVLGDDGTYGSSVEYVFWWDSAGVYHQHYVQGGQILHVASQPLAVKSVVLNMELQ